MHASKLATAKYLAKVHFGVEPNLKHVYLLKPLNEDDKRDPIKLLEIVEGTLERGVEPVAFPADPARGVDYPVLIVEMSPREYGDLASKELYFRDRTWTIGEELIAH
jgi:hypothetical protein